MSHHILVFSSRDEFLINYVVIYLSNVLWFEIVGYAESLCLLVPSVSSTLGGIGEFDEVFLTALLNCGWTKTETLIQWFLILYTSSNSHTCIVLHCLFRKINVFFVLFSRKLKHLWQKLTLFVMKLYMLWIISTDGWNQKGYFYIY